ncbi:conserved hypothetical protein [Anaeromyxobacter dehalogenans 2CP-1]|uniref:Uncharacterized protein n=1 Tax=Anaeromyxobacter dehalogenans (strain ATCC BAA-258 / DSM 21875 / 2CP-1) TaxID=455488 RepID=B8JBI7_ANAD2|nr:hypothetical protein [Anaeromyxobacter dehalogenans]ACL67595.1 conserved hypothetical protein [Anaeromyxobacter dehalogenans 2CP-1]
MFTELRLERRLELLDLEERRLLTRAALGAAAAVALAVAGVVGAASLGASGATALSQALTTAPLPLAALVGAWAYGQRRRAGELRERRAEARTALEAGPDGDLLDDLGPAGRVSPADLIALERLMRTFYESASGAPAEKRWGRFTALFAPGALVETGRGGPSDAGLPVDRYVALARLEGREVWLREVERTLHLLGEVAVALSAFEAHEPDAPAPTRGVNVLRLRKVRGAWEVEGVTSRPLERPVTLRRTLAPSSGPRPPPPRAA